MKEKDLRDLVRMLSRLASVDEKGNVAFPSFLTHQVKAYKRAVDSNSANPDSIFEETVPGYTRKVRIYRHEVQCLYCGADFIRENRRAGKPISVCDNRECRKKYNRDRVRKSREKKGDPN